MLAAALRDAQAKANSTFRKCRAIQAKLSVTTHANKQAVSTSSDGAIKGALI
jgi:hypothetical protein